MELKETPVWDGPGALYSRYHKYIPAASDDTKLVYVNLRISETGVEGRLVALPRSGDTISTTALEFRTSCEMVGVKGEGIRAARLNKVEWVMFKNSHPEFEIRHALFLLPEVLVKIVLDLESMLKAEGMEIVSSLGEQCKDEFVGKIPHDPKVEDYLKFSFTPVDGATHSVKRGSAKSTKKVPEYMEVQLPDDLDEEFNDEDS